MLARIESYKFKVYRVQILVILTSKGEKGSIYLSRTCSIVSAWRGLIDDT